jgi:hypothetical protein
LLLLGPKDARVTLRGLPMAEFAYFRQACLGVFEVGVRMFSRRVYARVHHLPMTMDLSFELSWV